MQLYRISYFFEYDKKSSGCAYFYREDSPSTLLKDMDDQEEPALLHPFEDEVELDEADSDTVILDEDEDFDYWIGGDFEDDVIEGNDELMDRDVGSYLAFLSQNHSVRAREE